MMRATWIYALVGVGWATASCGQSPRPAAPPALGGVLALAAVPSQADPIVATVNGKPVLASCVRAQTWAASNQDALDACVATELLAQQATAWLSASDTQATSTTAVRAGIAEAHDAFRGALADQMERLFANEVMKAPADMPANIFDVEFAALSKQYDQDGANGFTRPEFRAYRYLRINVPKGTAAALEDGKAKAAIDQIYKTFAGRRDILGVELQQAVDAADPAWGIDAKAFDVARGALAHRDSLEKTFADQLFSLSAPGSISAPVRTPWGWDLVYLDNIWPSEHFPREQIMREMFPRLRRDYFTKWVAGLASDRGWQVTVHEDVVSRTSDVGGR